MWWQTGTKLFAWTGGTSRKWAVACGTGTCVWSGSEYMGKPSHSVYQQFLKEYDAANRQTGKQQYAVPYFMSSHPGCTMKEAVKLAEYVRDLGFTPEQVQDFYPTPSTLSTCMYYTGIHPLTGEKVYVPKNPHEKSNTESFDAVQESCKQRTGAGRPEKWPEEWTW